MGTVLIGGVTVIHGARNLLESSTWLARGLLAVLFGGTQTVFWLVVSLAALQPLLALAGIALFAFGTWTAVRLAPQFVMGLPQTATPSSVPPFSPRLALTLSTTLCAALPLFLAYLYALGGARNFWDFPPAWIAFFALLPFILGCLLYCPWLTRLFRLTITCAALTALIVATVVRFPPSSGQSGDLSPLNFLIYPAKLITFITPDGGIAQRKMLDQPLPSSFIRTHHLQTDTTRGQFLDARESISETETTDIVKWCEETTKSPAGWHFTDGDKVRELILRKATIDFNRFVNQPRERYGLASSLLGAYAAAHNPVEDEALRSLLADRQLSQDRHWQIVKECKWGTLSKKQQTEVARLITPRLQQSLRDTTTRKGNRQTVKAEDGTDKIVDWIRSCVISPNNLYVEISQRLACPEAFQMTQEFVLAQLPPRLRVIFPDDNELVTPSAPPSPERVAAYHQTHPVYFWFILSYFPLDTDGNFFDVALSALPEETPASTQFLKLAENLDNPRFSAACLHQIAIDQFTCEVHKKIISRLLANAALTGEPVFLEKLLASSSLRAKDKENLLSSLFNDRRGRLTLDEIVAAFDQQPSSYSLSVPWHYLITDTDIQSAVRLVVKLAPRQIDLTDCVSTSRSYPTIKAALPTIIDEGITVKIAEWAQSRLYQRIDEEGDGELADRYLGYLRDKLGNASAGRLLAARRGEAVDRQTLFDDLERRRDDFDLLSLRFSSKDDHDLAAYATIAWQRGGNTAADLRKAGAWSALCAYPFYAALLFLVPATVVGMRRRRPVLCGEFSPAREGNPACRTRYERPLTGWAAAALIAVCVILQIICAVLCGALRIDAADAMLLTVVNVMALGLTLLLGVKLTGGSWSDTIPFKPFPLATLPPLIPLLCGCAVVFSELDNLLRAFIPAPKMFTAPFEQLASQGLTALVALSLCAPLTEEPLFRGLFLRSFCARYGVRRAILLSSLLFAALHMNPYQFTSAFFLGILFAWLTLRTGSLIPAILGHAFYNSQGIILLEVLKAAVPGFNLSPVEEIHFQPWWLDAAGVGCIVFGIIWLGSLRFVPPISK